MQLILYSHAASRFAQESRSKCILSYDKPPIQPAEIDANFRTLSCALKQFPPGNAAVSGWLSLDANDRKALPQIFQLTANSNDQSTD